MSLLKQLVVNPVDLRGVGIQVSRLESSSKNKSGTRGLDDFLMRGKDSTAQGKRKLAHNDQTSGPTKPSGVPQVPELDAEVLAALPEDIKQEVLQEYNRTAQLCREKNRSNTDELAVPGTSGLQNVPRIPKPDEARIPDDSSGSSSAASVLQTENVSFSQVCLLILVWTSKLSIRVFTGQGSNGS